MKKIIITLLLLVSCNVFAQEALNAYEYVVVPSKFDFQKNVDQDGVNSLLKLKFQQLGFKAFLDNEVLPDNIKRNTCLYLVPVLKVKSNMFITKSTVEVFNCDKEVLYVTDEGADRSKNKKVSNIQSLRGALKSFDKYSYKYQPIAHTQQSEAIVVKEKVVKTEEVYVPKGNVYLFKGDKYEFVNNNYLYHKEIINTTSKQKLGVLSKSSKQGIYHVDLKGDKGLGYYDENGSFIVEVLSNNGEVVLCKFQLLN